MEYRLRWYKSWEQEWVAYVFDQWIEINKNGSVSIGVIGRREHYMIFPSFELAAPVIKHLLDAEHREVIMRQHGI